MSVVDVDDKNCEDFGIEPAVPCPFDGTSVGGVKDVLVENYPLFSLPLLGNLAWR